MDGAQPKATSNIENTREASKHSIEAQDTEGDLHKRMVSSKSVEVRTRHLLLRHPTTGENATQLLAYFK